MSNRTVRWTLIALVWSLTIFVGYLIYGLACPAIIHAFPASIVTGEWGGLLSLGIYIAISLLGAIEILLFIGVGGTMLVKAVFED